MRTQEQIFEAFLQVVEASRLLVHLSDDLETAEIDPYERRILQLQDALEDFEKVSGRWRAVVRSKFRCISITETEGTDKPKQYVFVAATNGEENKSWSKWTPCGRLEITITNPDAKKFEVGKEYCLDIADWTP